jgi:hypothetical protein
LEEAKKCLSSNAQMANKREKQENVSNLEKKHFQLFSFNYRS